MMIKHVELRERVDDREAARRFDVRLKYDGKGEVEERALFEFFGRLLYFITSEINAHFTFPF